MEGLSKGSSRAKSRERGNGGRKIEWSSEMDAEGVAYSKNEEVEWGNEEQGRLVFENSIVCL